jgi:S-DNA-T family DNA segregation ATPase FtsK/SpoIIIE
MPDAPLSLPGPATPGAGEIAVPDPAEVVVDAAVVPPRRPVYVLHVITRHPVPRAAAQHALYVPGGLVALARQRRRRRTLATMLAEQAGAAGDQQMALQLLQQAELERKQRQDRWKSRVEILTDLAKASPALGAIWVILMILTGVSMAWAHHSAGYVLWPWRTLADFISVLVTGFMVLIWVLSFGIPLGFLAWLHHLGRTRADLPLWLMPAARREEHEGNPVTPSVLVTGLRDVGLPVLRKAVQSMDDGAAQMLGLITAAGCGIGVDVYLPTGVSTSEIIARREKLAENVGRHKHELFITVPSRPRTVRLWIADSGALDEPIGPSPLVTDHAARADYRKGRAPWGQSLDGSPSTLSVFQRHVLVTGISNHGKTAALRALALWLSLSARVRFWIADFKGVGDWGMFDGLAEVLVQGPTDEHVAAGTHMAEAGVAEMQERTALMQQLTAQGWTQEKILADPRFDPLVLIFDEAQKAYGCGAAGDDGRPYGGTKNTSRYFQAIKAIHDQGRAVCVTTWEGTQDPTNENLPKRTREGNHIRASLVVGTEAQAAMALGENAVAAGAAPHELRQGADKGVVVVAGDVTAFDAPRGQTFTIIRTHLIGDEDAAAIAARAVKLRGGRLQARDVPAIVAPPRDLLDDLAQVVDGDERVSLADLCHRLRRLAPSWMAYKALNSTELRQLLAGKVRTTNPKNVPTLDPADLREALAERGE